jgi:hypothetical protein
MRSLMGPECIIMLHEGEFTAEEAYTSEEE